MTSHYYVDDECNKCTYYARFIQDSNPWKCEICLLNEAGIEDGTNSIVWGRYQLECEHQVHIRCMRKWCKAEGQVGCPRCGPITEIETKQFCVRCEQFGHATTACLKR